MEEWGSRLTTIVPPRGVANDGPSSSKLRASREVGAGPGDQPQGVEEGASVIARSSVFSVRSNAEYERALKSMASSDDKTLVHYVFSQWQDALREAVRQREIAAAQYRMRNVHNAEYERALKPMASSDDTTLVHYVCSQWQDVL